MTRVRQYCTFTVGDLYLGIPVTRVQEAIRFQDMTRVPLADDAVEGLINLRGQIVTAVDLRRRLELPARPEGLLPMNVVVTAEEGSVSLLVDDVDDVVQVRDEQHEPPPETLVGAARSLITGTYTLADRLLLVLDADRAIGLSAAPR